MKTKSIAAVTFVSVCLLATGVFSHGGYTDLDANVHFDPTSGSGITITTDWLGSKDTDLINMGPGSDVLSFDGGPARIWFEWSATTTEGDFILFTDDLSSATNDVLLINADDIVIVANTGDVSVEGPFTADSDVTVVGDVITSGDFVLDGATGSNAYITSDTGGNFIIVLGS